MGAIVICLVASCSVLYLAGERYSHGASVQEMILYMIAQITLVGMLIVSAIKDKNN